MSYKLRYKVVNQAGRYIRNQLKSLYIKLKTSDIRHVSGNRKIPVEKNIVVMIYVHSICKKSTKLLENSEEDERMLYMKRRSRKYVLKRLVEAYIDLQLLKGYEVYEINIKDVLDYMKKMLDVNSFEIKERDYLDQVVYDYVHKFDY